MLERGKSELKIKLERGKTDYLQKDDKQTDSRLLISNNRCQKISSWCWGKIIVILEFHSQLKIIQDKIQALSEIQLSRVYDRSCPPLQKSPTAYQSKNQSLHMVSNTLHYPQCAASYLLSLSSSFMFSHPQWHPYYSLPGTLLTRFYSPSRYLYI